MNENIDLTKILKDCPMGCISEAYTYCIPYNDETKHLVGTKDKAPEFYRHWED